MKEKECPVCLKKGYMNSKHRKNCFGEDADYKIKYIKHNSPGISSDILKNLYLIEKWSIPMIGKKFNLDNKSVCHILRHYEIPIRTIKETRNLAEYKSRIENTNLKKYGATNPLAKGTEPYKKRNQTVIDKYGCENVWQRMDLFIDNWNNLGKHSKISSLNKKLYEILNELNIDFTPEYSIKYNVEGKNKWKSFDAKIGNLLIEINGNYWHANPTIYNKDAVFYFPGSTLTAQEIWNLDEQKKHIANINGFDMIVIWEDEIKNAENVKQKIKNSINNKN